MHFISGQLAIAVQNVFVFMHFSKAAGYIFVYDIDPVYSIICYLESASFHSQVWHMFEKVKPDVLTHYLHLRRPVHGLIFLFKWKADDEPEGSVVRDSRLDKIFFAKQVLVLLIRLIRCVYYLNITCPQKSAIILHWLTMLFFFIYFLGHK